MSWLRSLLAGASRDCAGSALVEFAIIFPAFLLAVIGGLYVAMLGFTSASLQNAVRAGARCYSLNSSSCTDTTKTAAYAKTRFVSVTADVPTFTAATAACGYQVNGSVSFTFNAGIYRFTVPLTSKACFP